MSVGVKDNQVATAARSNVHLETELPASLPAGRPTAVFVKGTRDGKRFWETIVVEAPADLGPLGRVEATEPSQAAPAGASLAICMATFEPDPELFQRQV